MARGGFDAEAAPKLQTRPRRILAYCGRKMVLTMGSTLENLGDDNDSGNYGLNPGITTSNSAFQSGYSAWSNYLKTWSNLTLVLSGHSIYQSWHAPGSWFFQQQPLTSSSARAQTVQGIFSNWQEADAGNYSPAVPGGGGDVGPGTFCSLVPQGAGGARIAHVMLLHFRPSAGKLDGYALSTNTGSWERAYTNRAMAPASAPQLLFSVDYPGVPRHLLPHPPLAKI